MSLRVNSCADLFVPDPPVVCTTRFQLCAYVKDPIFIIIIIIIIIMKIFLSRAIPSYAFTLKRYDQNNKAPTIKRRTHTHKNIPRALCITRSTVLSAVQDRKNPAVAQRNNTPRTALGQQRGPPEDHNLHPNHRTYHLRHDHPRTQKKKKKNDSLQPHTPNNRTLLFCLS